MLAVWLYMIGLCAKGIMDENTPLLSDPYEMGAYTIAKVRQEQVVAKFARLSHGD